jgi:hypothetical protein
MVCAEEKLKSENFRLAQNIVLPSFWKSLMQDLQRVLLK